MADHSKKNNGLQIISLGLGRTGSLSIYLALKQLGYSNVYHSLHLADQKVHTDKWVKLAKKKFIHKQIITKADLDDATQGLEAVTSAPYWAFPRELMESYPDAKIIIVNRDPEKWYASFASVVGWYIYSWEGFILRWFAQPLLNRQDMLLCYLCVTGYYNAATRSQLQTKAKDVEKVHREGIRELARLQGREILEYQLGSGWEPLCCFLGSDVPQGTDFPRSNEKGKILEGIRSNAWRQIWEAGGVVGRYAVVVGAVAVGVYFWGRRGK